MIARARLLVTASVGLPLALVLVGQLIDLPPRGAAWVGPVTLLGLVSPVIGYRLFAWLGERAGDDADPAAFLRATLLAMATTETVALLGWAVHIWSGRIAPLAGVAAHVLLAGALWPTPERMDAFVEGDR